MSNLTDNLWKAVQARVRPEEVAQTVLSHYPGVPHLDVWKSRVRRNHSHMFSYMNDDFAKPSPLTKSANTLVLLLLQNFPDAPVRFLNDEETLGVEMSGLLEEARALLKMERDSALDYRTLRWNRYERAKLGLTISRRQYDRLYRMLMFLNAEHGGNRRYGQLCQLLRGAKSALATQLSLEEFSKDDLTAVFVAYMCSQMNRRSIFTNAAQEKPFDDLASRLLDTLHTRDNTNWFAIAHVFPRNDVLMKLTDQQKMNLLSLSLIQMHSAASFLKQTAEAGAIDLRKGCVVQPGQDSSTWNGAAGAWNKARDWWLSLCADLGMDVSLMLPGKTPRLMAADVAYWHKISGGQPHPDELVVKELPMPWDVLFGDAQCTMKMVVKACKKHRVDGAQTGWFAPRSRTQLSSWSPTPELVHGVIVDDPLLAHIFRKLNWFCGPSQAVKSMGGK